MKKSDVKKVGRVLLLLDGLSTWIISSYHSQIIGEELFDQYLKIDRVSKSYLRNRINNPSSFALNILISSLESLWADLLEAHAVLDISIPEKVSLSYDLKQRITVFKNYDVRNDAYGRE